MKQPSGKRADKEERHSDKDGQKPGLIDKIRGYLPSRRDLGARWDRLPAIFRRKPVDTSDTGADFKREVKINITNTILLSVVRWVYFIGIIGLFYKLALDSGEDSHMAVACAILFFIYPYYAYKTFAFFKWYAGVYRQEKYWIIQPFELIYIYVYNKVKSVLESRYPWLPFRGWVTKYVIKKECRDKLLWANVAVLVGMYGLGWSLYLIYYEKLMYYATGLDFKRFWEPFVWPFTVVF